MRDGSPDPTLRTLDDDDCCGGTRRRTPAEIYNRPGLQAVRYRRGTHARFKETMLARLSARDRKGVLEPPAEGGVEGERITEKESNGALEAFTARNDDDFTIALLDAFAAMADVLTFYQERVANEAYLRTASERFSVLELARLIGYQLDPGLAASTHLAFTLDDGPDAPPQVTIPARTPAQSVPKEADRLPQTFETVEEIEARAQWNELRPRMVRPQAVKLENKGVYLRRTNLNLRVGDMLLFVQRDKPSNPSDLRWDVRRITEVTPEPEMDRTLVRWVGEKVTDGRLFPQDVEVYVFRQRANVFGYNAADWRSLPDAAKATYLGVEDPSELTDVERREWPQFEIAAKKYEPEEMEPLQPYQLVYPTAESVAQAALSVAESVVAAANTDVLISLPTAGAKLVEAVATVLNEALGFANTVKDGLAGESADFIEAARALVQFLVDLPGTRFPSPAPGNALYPFPEVRVKPNTSILQFWGPDLLSAGGEAKWQDVKPDEDPGSVTGFFVALLKTISKMLGILNDPNYNPDPPSDELWMEFSGRLIDLFASVPFLAPLSVAQNLSGDLVGPDGLLDTSGTAITEAYNAITDVPERFAKAAGATIVAKVVQLAVQTAMDLPFPVEQDVVRTPHTIAFVALAAAKMATVAIKMTEITNPQEVIDEVLGSAIVLDCDLDDVAEKAMAAGALLAAGGTAVAAGGAVAALLAFMGPAIIPALMPYLVLAVALGNELADGAETVANNLSAALCAAIEPQIGPLSKRSPTFRLDANAIDLDAIHAEVTPDSWLLLSLPNKEALYKVADVAEVSRNDFNLNAKVTRVTLEDADLGPRYSITDKTLEALTTDDVPEDVRSALEGIKNDQYPGRDAFLDAVRAVLTHKQFMLYAPLILRYAEESVPFRKDVRMTTVFAHSEALTVADEPWADPIAGDRIDLDRQVPRLEPGRLLIVAGIGVPADQPDGRAGTPVSELVTLSHHDGDGLDTLVFTNELKHVYERGSVRVFANVVRATHGETQEEVLGSGDAGLASQSFQLKQTPLTYVDGQAEGGRASTLEVRVNDVLWEEAPFLHGSDPRRRAYSTEMDNEGRVTVRFGDGRHGARPHSGVENIRARYRNGVGQLGNVNAGEITLLTRRPPGLRAVTNPLPATGGTDPETYDDARRNAPGTVRLLERIVSLQDYEDYALTYPEVRKALATWVWEGRGRTIILTVAGQDGAQIEDARRETLRVDMRGRSDPHIGVRVEPFARVDFELAAKVLRDPGYEKEKVQAAVREALLAHFAFEKRQFGQPVTLVETMAVVQAVAGVVAVDVDCLYVRAVESTPSSGSEPIVLCLSASNLEDLQVYDNQLNCPEGSTPPPYLPAAMPQPASDQSSVQRAELLLPRQITLLFEKAAP